MSDLVVKRLDSLAALRDLAPAWDELWQHSEIAQPTARAELVALWCESFAPPGAFRAYVVQRDGQMVAALPLVARRRFGLRFAALPDNHWSTAGDLLVYPGPDGLEACEVLLEALKRQPARLLWLDAVASGTHRWQAFVHALDHERMAYATRPRFRVNVVRVGQDWDAYFDARSRNHRRAVRRAATRARAEGPTELACYDNLSAEQVEPLLRTGFEIEAAGWKGQAQGSVLQMPAIWGFYRRQASQLAVWGQLRLTLLQHCGRPIAFEYGWQAKGVYGSPKVGYDEAFGRLSPGQLLRHQLIERLHGRADVRAIDFMGPASPATSKWATDDYPVDRLVVPLGGPVARAVVAAYRHAGPLAATIRRRGSLASPVAPATKDPSPAMSDDVQNEPEPATLG